MAQTCGTKAKSLPEKNDRALHVLGRLVGFSLLTVLGLGILAVVVLLPPYMQVLRARYDLGMEKATNADYQDRIAAGQLLIEDIEQIDEVAIRTLAGSVLGRRPVDPEASHVPRRESMAPEVIHIEPNARPAPPPAWLGRITARVRQPAVRRGLFVLSAVALLAATILFRTPATRGQSH
jgi:hypothetical protein